MGQINIFLQVAQFDERSVASSPLAAQFPLAVHLLTSEEHEHGPFPTVWSPISALRHRSIGSNAADWSQSCVTCRSLPQPADG
ncbi:Uncharacterised protein [Vibrio cholerae]|nr:Uncharacterised protein [Vibrio cholerae]